MKLLLDQGLPLSAAGLLRDVATDPSVIRIRIQRLRARALTDLLLKVIAECEEDLEQGAAITVEPSRIRIRRLPLVPDV